MKLYAAPLDGRRTSGVTVAVTTEQPRRVTLKDAAQILGISKEAVRKRVKRGTLLSEKAPDGRVYVYLDDRGDAGGDFDRFEVGESAYSSGTDYRDALITELREEVAAWREEARRKDTIILSLSQRIPELMGLPSETPPGPQTSPEGDANGVTSEPEERAYKRPWWRRWFEEG